MKIAGHTMGTPDMSVKEAIAFFAKIGLDGIDLICTDDYKCAIPLDVSREQIRQLKDDLDKAGLELANLTPYAKRLNAPDAAERARNIELMKQSVILADRCACRSLRLWSGDEATGEDSRPGFDLAVASIREVADFANDYGIILNLENHVGTLTPTIKQQLALIDAVGSSSVKALLDPGCLVMEPGAEEGVMAVQMLENRIGLVHAKDVIVTNKPEIWHVPVGQGETDWTGILKKLQTSGYEGYISLEYERRWHPDMLPEPEIGMVQSLNFVRSILALSKEKGEG